MGKLFQLWRVFFPKNTAQQKAASEKASLIRAHEKELHIWQRMVETLEAENATLRAQKAGNMEEMLMGAVINMFTPQGSTPPQMPTQTGIPQFTESSNSNQLESGVKYSDDQIKNLLSGMPPQYLNGIAKQPLAVFKKIAKKQLPNISEESIAKAHEMAQTMVRQ